MSQVLGFGFPAGERLRCDNPICDELAEHSAKASGPDGDRDIFGCTTHFEQLLSNQNVTQRTKLKKPGERNHQEDLPKARPSGQS
jgi:hypothetical protein